MSQRPAKECRSPQLRLHASTGFTLVEVLVALALVSLVLVAMNTLIFSMGELWGKNTDVHAFDQHVRNVSRFLEAELRAAALPPASSTEGGVAPKELKTQGGATEPLVTFELPAGSRLIHWPDRPLPDVECGLAVRDRVGLVLVYHSKAEKNFEQDPARETLITPLVTAISYDFFDTDFMRWRTETALRKEADGTYKSPQRIRLKFAYGKLTREAVIQLPAKTEGLPFL